MKLIARMIAFLSFLVMFQYANAASNTIYMDQVGDGTTITITQSGDSNQIGSSTTRSTFNGDNNTVTIDQIGNGNITNIQLYATGATVTKSVTGNTNTTELNCGGMGSSCGASTISNVISGDSNSVTHNVDGLTNTSVTINSNSNTVTINDTSSAIAGSKNTINISGGDSNNLAIAQAGVAATLGHETDVTVVGATNTIDLRQGGTVDSKIVSTITGSGNNVLVKSNHP